MGSFLFRRAERCQGSPRVLGHTVRLSLRLASIRPNLSFMSCAVLFTLTTLLVAGGLESIKDNTGATIGYLQRQGEKTFVRDRCQRTLGYVTEKGTFTDTGIRKAQSPLPSMLLESARNCASRQGSK